jgi:uncharacterized protein (TIGR00375 family)
MPWTADLHIHSHYSMATSKECNPQNLHRWAALKGVALVGTGDFTHPGWRAELRENLLPAEAGFYRLKGAPAPEIPGQPEVRFVVTGELSTIYKKNERTRKIHHLLVLPSLEAADRISARLEALGMNIRSDGRPILGLDSYLLLQLVLELAPETIFIPAHIWTPHFSVFGSNSGFDTLAECYEDLTPQIFALETGLSSDPPMNWRWSALDRFNLVSNSDAHNPQNLAREANLFSGEFSYPGIKRALMERDSADFNGTLEFFPEEGKYHLDGHRNCQICWKPEETHRHGAICPVCGKKVTVGVASRIAALADRPAGFKPADAKDFLSLVPLREIIGAAFNVGAKTQKAERIYRQLLRQFGPELDILTQVDPKLIAASAGDLVATGIRRLRERQVIIKPGYDGEYGVISLFDEAERRAILGQAKLFTLENPKKKPPAQPAGAEPAAVRETAAAVTADPLPAATAVLSSEQQQVVTAGEPVIRVIAGPGAGKTRTLVERIAYLIRERGVDPAVITAVTFTNKAAAEIKDRVIRLLDGCAGLRQIQIGTFHSLAWKIINCNPAGQPLQLVDRYTAEALIAEVLQEEQLSMKFREATRQLGLIKNQLLFEAPDGIAPQLWQLYQAYQQKLTLFQRCDFDDILIQAVELWTALPEWLEPWRRRFTYLLVDEFQDVNPLQYRLVAKWAADSRSLMVIGDPNQSIYGFRGSDSRFFNDLQTDFPDAASLQLTRNYRATASLIAAANSLIAPQLRQMVPETPNWRQITGLTWLKTADSQQAAAAITQEIIRLIGGSTMLTAGSRGHKGLNPLAADTAYGFSDIAVLYRTNRQSEALETALATVGLPYRVVGPVETLTDAAVQAFLSFCHHLDQPTDCYWLREAIGYPVWELSGDERKQVNNWLRETAAPENTSRFPLDYLLQQAEGPLLEKLRHFAAQSREFDGKINQGLPQLLADWIAQTGVSDLLELEHLDRIAANYTGLRELFRALPLATEADLSRSNQPTDVRRESLTLSTIHASKGLEYPVIFVAGVEEGLLPFGSDLSAADVAEEQRLFYVALTRARQRCYLVSSGRQWRNGEPAPVEPSRYLQLLPKELLQVVEPKARPVKSKQLELF